MLADPEKGGTGSRRSDAGRTRVSARRL